MNESKALALSVVVAVVGALILVVATSGAVSTPRSAHGSMAEAVAAQAVVAASSQPTSTAGQAPTPTPALIPAFRQAQFAPVPASPNPAPAPTLIPAFRQARFAPVPASPTPAPTFVASMIAPTPTPPPPPAEREPDRSGNFVPVPFTRGVQHVDFTSGFTYPVGGIGPVIVDGGDGAVGESGTDDYANVRVGEVVYGDLTGDGIDEAAVVVTVQARTWEPTSNVWIFGLENGYLERLGTTWVGQFGGPELSSLTIADRLLRVESSNESAASLAESFWMLTRGGVQQVEQSGLRSWVDVRSGSADGLHPVEVRGPASIWATVAADRSSPKQTISFEIEGPWTARLTPERGHGAIVRIRDSSGRLVGDLTEDAVVQLPGAGTYRGELLFAVGATAEVVFDLDIADQRTLRAPRWQPRASRTVESDSAYRFASAAWPEFVMPSNPDAATAVNEIIGDFIAELQQEHTQAVTACADDEDAMHSITYRPTLVSYDLVAIDFEEFICMCEDGDEVRRHSVVVDLNTGQPLGLNDIVTLDSVELPALWWEVFLAQSYWSPEGLDVRTTELDFTAASLHPHGVSITADVSGLPDGPLALTATLSFDDLGDMVRPGIAIRAASGAGAPYPIEEHCGC